MRPGAVVLLSGGVESSVMLAGLAATSRPIHPLFFDYGQKGALRELEAARWCLRSPAVAGAGDSVRPLEIMDLASVGASFRRHNRRHVPLPHRNLPLLALAALAFAAHVALGCAPLIGTPRYRAATVVRHQARARRLVSGHLSGRSASRERTLCSR